MTTIQDLVAEMPKCGLTCLVSAIQNSTCALTDTACTCASTSINNAATLCIQSACSVRDQLSSKNLTSSLCGITSEVYDPYLGVYVAFTVITGVIVALRFLSRAVGKATFWWDDWFNIGAVLGSAAYTTVGLVSRNFGQGTDIWFVPFDDITNILKTFFANFILYVLSRGFTRISILFFYLRIFTIRRARIMIITTIAITVVMSLVFVLVLVFQCSPIDYFWLEWDGEHHGHCVSTGLIVWACAIITIVFDFWIIIIPLLYVLRLQLSLKKRILASIMFAVGVISLAISIARTQFINEFTQSTNITFDARPLAAWSLLEIDVGIVCACLPAIQVLLRPIWEGKFFGGSNNGVGPGGSNNFNGKHPGGGSSNGSARVGEMQDEVVLYHPHSGSGVSSNGGVVTGDASSDKWLYPSATDIPLSEGGGSPHYGHLHHHHHQLPIQGGVVNNGGVGGMGNRPMIVMTTEIHQDVTPYPEAYYMRPPDPEGSAESGVGSRYVLARAWA